MWGLISAGMAIALLVGSLALEEWRIDNLKEKADSLRRDNLVLNDNFDTCQQANASNLIVINRQKESIAGFITAKNEALERNRLLAEELAERQLADREESEEVRNEVSEILSAEACAAVEHPARVHRLLNDAIAKASGGGDGGG